MPETAEKYELSFLKACRRFDIRWDSLRFLCISLGWRLLKSMSYTFSEHAERLILAETFFNLYAFACAEDCSTIWSFLRACRTVAIIWDILQFLCISLCRRLLRSISYPFSEHAERVMFCSICNDMGIFPVINGDWNTLLVSIFRNIWTIWDLSDQSRLWAWAQSLSNSSGYVSA